jgi:hypothetical protein
MDEAEIAGIGNFHSDIGPSQKECCSIVKSSALADVVVARGKADAFA